MPGTSVSRLAPPAFAGGAGVLIVLIGALAVGGPTTVDGSPVAAAATTAAAPSGAAIAAAPPPSLPTSATPPPAAPTTEVPATSAPPAEPPAQPPAQRPGTVRLTNGGTAALVRQELAADATLPVPASLGEATWWGADLNGGAGAMVLAGHVNWKGKIGPFSELWDSRVGDPVTVVGADGTTRRFTVSKIDTVAKEALPGRAEELFGQTGPHRLVLVTCGGRWVGGHDGYESNRVVTALPA
ncbi:class F sortase [Actinokineospora pegani]|uniref:class F sortase n=1 Tax=Actinokineospora pegani TaxID=2654637 RepID=UPI0012E9DED6|nr:class F sortase [Actinokineospora pegani]